jgi:hypothetical protein
MECLKRGTFLKFYIPFRSRLSTKVVRIVTKKIKRKYLGISEIWMPLAPHF